MIYNQSKFNLNWHIKTLSQLGVFKRGKSKHRPRNDKKLFEDGTFPLVQTGEISAANLYIRNHSAMYNDFGLKQSMLWPQNTLCITIAANIAETALLGYPMCFPDSIVGFNAYNEESSELFMHYVFTFIKKAIQNSASGSIQDNINIEYLTSLKFRIPDKIYQDKIASVLSSLDAKIELNNRINAELEAMAKTLYDYWFVQFDFPNEEGKPYKTSGGVMVWNDELKREIPEGWEVVELSDIANILMGQSPPGESYNENGEGMIFYQGCTDFGNRFPTVRKYTTEPSRFAKEGDILLSVRAPVGTLNIAKEDCCIGRGLAALNSKDNCISFLFGVMVNLKQVFDRRNVDGTTFGSITKEDLFSLKVIKPTSEVLEQFNNLVNPSFIKQNTIELENIKLSELRDWLLPMLMNGQVTITTNENIQETIATKPQSVNKTTTNNTQIDNFKKIQILYATIWANKELNVKQGEMATAKDVYLLDRIYGVKTGFQFKQQNWGAFDPKEKQLLNTTQYFHKPNFPNSQAFYVDLKDDGKLLEKIPTELLEQIRTGIQEMNDKVFKNYSPSKKAEKKELFATVLKCIEDRQSLELDIIRDAMAKWKIKQAGKETTKAAKFSEDETNEALEVIVSEGWYKQVLLANA
jgi:type I restriction enzyme S subunit